VVELGGGEDVGAGAVAAKGLCALYMRRAREWKECVRRRLAVCDV
jgi:hypothetical protein